MRIVKLIAGLILATSAAAQVLPPSPITIPPSPELEAAPLFKEPVWLGQKYVNEGDFRKLEDLIENLVTTKARNKDGRPELFMLEQGLDEWFEIPRSAGDRYINMKLEGWKREFPTSAYQPIVTAMYMNSAAWRARGNGFASTVTDEGWELFHQLSRNAWFTLINNKETSSRIPSWYSNAISFGLSAGIPAAEISSLFDEGIARHPGYLPIYFSYLRVYAPRWGGTFEDADKFIRDQVTAKTNVDGEVLYTRLYWSLDQYNGQQASLFEESLVSWTRMRKGFEQMMREYPESDWNLANFASFACRAHDATSYGKLRPKVFPVRFEEASPEGISLDVCDARFMKKA